MGLDPFAFGSTLLDPPARPALASSVGGLRSMGALDAAADAPKLSALGGHLAALPCAARLGKLLVLGATQGSKRERNSQLQRLISRPFSTRFG
jgi:HrpA-like RNA helicase